MFEVENLEFLYRARRFWYTPSMNQAIAKILNQFGDRADIPTEFMAQFVAGMQRVGIPSSDGWNTYYEPCKVLRTTAITIVVKSVDLAPDIKELFPDFYAGGIFMVRKPSLQRDGFAHHTRHGEKFYINPPQQAIALPSALKALQTA